MRLDGRLCKEKSLAPGGPVLALAPSDKENKAEPGRDGGRRRPGKAHVTDWRGLFCLAREFLLPVRTAGVHDVRGGAVRAGE